MSTIQNPDATDAGTALQESASQDVDVDDPEDGATEEPRQLSDDKIFHILQNQRRRDALRYLTDTEGKVRMRDLAEQVAAWEHDTTLQALTSDQRQRVYIALYQSHLPKLDEEGVIEYNQSRGVVERTPLADQLDRYLDTPTDDDHEEDVESVLSERDQYFGSVAGLSLLLLGGVGLGLDAAALAGVGAVGVAVLVGFTLFYGRAVDVGRDVA